MPRPQRFPNKIEFWTTDDQLRGGLELLIADGLTDKSAHLRQAVQMYLRAAGIVPTRPTNGAAHHYQHPE
jgi:hypothetical protein